jgi:hypothetical protein
MLYELATSQQTAEAQWWRAVRKADFEIPLEQRMGEWINQLAGREQVYRRAIREYQGRFEAAVKLTARRWRGIHEIDFWSRPDAADTYQYALITWALGQLKHYPVWPVKVNLSTTQRVAKEILLEHGFEERHTLLTMRRRMR